MDQNPSSLRVIELTEAAAYDLIGIDNATAQLWGESQAERYAAYIREMFAFLALQPSLGTPVEGRPGSFVYIAKFRKRRSAHGHRIFYTQIEEGILILRVLHTAMNWPDHMAE